MAKIVLARHGETAANRNGFIMGRSDAPLTRKGARTVKEMSPIIARQGVRRIIASPLGRAAVTAAIHSERLRIPIYFSHAISELSCGTWEGIPRAQVTTGPIRKTWQFRPPGGESYQDGEGRVVLLVAEILRLTRHEPVLVVGHASVNRVFMKLLLNLDPFEAMAIRSLHDTVYVIEHRRDVRYVSCSGHSGDGFLMETE